MYRWSLVRCLPPANACLPHLAAAYDLTATVLLLSKHNQLQVAIMIASGGYLAVDAAQQRAALAATAREQP